VERFGQEVLLLFAVGLVFGLLLLVDAVEGFTDILGRVGLVALGLRAVARLSFGRPLMRRLASGEGRFH